MSENLKNLLIVLAVFGIVIFIVNRKETFTSVSKLISGIDNMTEKELNDYEKKLMDGHDLKVLKKFNKENEILEKSLNVGQQKKHDEDKNEDDDEDDSSSIKPAEDETNYADIKDEYHLDEKIKRCKKKPKKINSNLSSNMIIGNNIDEEMYEDNNMQQIEDEEDFRKFLSIGKNKLKDSIYHDEVKPFVDDELQKFINSEEDEIENSVGSRNVILSEKKIAKSKFFEENEYDDSDEELDEEQIFVDPKVILNKKKKKAISQKINNNIDEKKYEMVDEIKPNVLLKEISDEDPYAIIDETEPQEIIKKITKAKAIESNEELPPRQRVIRNMYEEELPPRQRVIRNMYEEELPPKQKVIKQIYEEEDLPPKQKVIKQIYEEEESIYTKINEEQLFIEDEDEDEFKYAIFDEKPIKQKARKIIDEEIPNIGYKEIEEELDDEMLLRKIYHSSKNTLEEEYDEEEYDEEEYDEEEYNEEEYNEEEYNEEEYNEEIINYDNYFDEDNVKNIIPEEDEMKQRFTDYQEEDDTYQIEQEVEDDMYSNEETNDFIPYQNQEEEEYTNYQDTTNLTNDFIPYEEEEQYNYLDNEKSNQNMTGLNRLKNVIQNEMIRQEEAAEKESGNNEILDIKSKHEMKDRLKHQVKCGTFINPKYNKRISGCGTKAEMKLHKPNNDKLNSLRNRTDEDVPKAIRDIYNDVIPKYHISKDQTCQHVQKGLSMSSCSGTNKPLINNIYASDRCFDKYSNLGN